jgi:hypothetical protein
VRIRVVNTLRVTLGGIATAIRGRPRAFGAVALGVFMFNLAAPPVILSIARKPVDFFTFNPWLSRLPEYLASSEDPLTKKLAFLSNMAIAWFSADNPVEGVEWGFIVDVPSLMRIVFTSFIFGAYFALWYYRRDQLGQCGWGTRASRQGGMAGALTSVLGLTTGPCTVAGCGVPVLPVVGLAFTGVSSSTLAFFATLARVGIAVVLFGMSLGVAWLGWRVGSSITPSAPGTGPPR